MQSIKHSLLLGVSLSLFVFTGGLVWGPPFIHTGSGPMLAYAQEQQNAQAPQTQEPAKSITFTGTIVRDGELFVLRDASGAMYKLDDGERAKPFEGKAVKVTGRLDEEAKLIHVENIEEAAA